MKKQLLSLLLCGVMVSGSVIPVLATENNSNDQKILTIQEQEKLFEDIEKNIKSGKTIVEPDKDSNEEVIHTKASSGTYPSRAGTFLVTDGLRTDSLLGHAGMVLGSNLYMESFKNDGVRYHDTNWTKKYKRVHGYTANGTSSSQDRRAAEWTRQHYGKPYNTNFFDIETTSKFYCSQLVYKAFKTETGVNLNLDGGPIYPADLGNTPNSKLIYKYDR